MRAVFTILVFFTLSVGVAQGVELDYLKHISSEVTPSYTAKIGQGVNAHLVLNGTTPLPDETRLNISTSVVRPRIEVIIDGKLEWYGVPELELPLPVEGVKRIEIRVFGNAPEVTKETNVAVLDVKTYVKYKGENGVYQDDGRLSLIVSNIVITDAVDAIDNAKRKLEIAEKIIGDLKAVGIGTASLEAKLKNVEDLLSTAEALYEKEDIELSKNTAESAIKILDETVFEAGTLEATEETKSSLVKYGLIGVVVIVIAVLLLLFMRRREELG